MDEEYTVFAHIIQRARGCYLVSWSELRDGLEDHEAAPSVAAAKRWLREQWPDMKFHTKPNGMIEGHASDETEDDDG